MKKMTEKTAPVSPAGLSPANLTHTPVPSPAGLSPANLTHTPEPAPVGLSPATLPHTPVPSPAGHTLYARLRDFALPGIVVRRLQPADRPFWLAFAAVFLALNHIFLFHGAHFMFGDHDWNYVRGASAWNEGAFEGRPLHFVLQAVLFDGQVLPFLNSLFSFAALVLGYILLARYWQVPLTTFNYALYAVFAKV